MMTDETLTPTDQPEAGTEPQEQAAAAPDASEASQASMPTPDPEAPTPPETNDAPKPEETPGQDVPSPEIPAPPTPEPEAPAQPADPQPAQPSASNEPVDDAALFDAAMSAMDTEEQGGIEGSYKKLSKGDRIEATVIQVDRDRVFVDLGTKSEGIVPLGELSEQSLDSAKGYVTPGEKIDVVVLRPEGGEGNPIVSKKRADFEDAWNNIERAFEQGTYITAKVIDRVKGGLVVDVGVRGFIPGSHVGSGKERNLEKYVGRDLQLKIIEIDRERKKVVLSNRQAEEERQKKAQQEIFEKVSPGDRLVGTIRRLTDYGAFIDLGGVDGLLHISEMSWSRINHPKEMFKEGQQIEVMVLRLDPAIGKISLGHRQVLPDPWNLIRERYKIGQRINCTIGRIVQSGAFIRLPEGAEAFMPVSEMSSRRIRQPQDVVQEGQEVEAQILDLRPDERRMVLSMRAVGGGAVPDYSRQGPVPASQSFDDERGDKRGKKGKKKGRGGRQDEDDFEEVIGRRGFASGGATIGERLGILKGVFGRDDDEIEDEETSAATEEAGEETTEEKSEE